MESIAPRTTHLEFRQLDALRRGALDVAETRRVRSHLAEPCAGCARRVAEILVRRYGDLPRPVGAGGSRRVVVSLPSLGSFARHHTEAAAWEEAVAPGLARALEPWAEAEAFRLIGDEPAYRTHALASHLTEECRRRVIRDSRAGYHLGRLAVAVAAHAPEERYGRGLCADLRGEAAMALANAARCCSRFYEARRMLQLAEEFLGEGTGNVMCQVQLSSTRASIARGLGYFREALDEVNRGHRHLPEHEGGDFHLRLKLKMAGLLVNLDPVLGLELNRSLLRTIDRDRYPMFDYCARMGIVAGLYRSGRGAVAVRLSRTLETHEITTRSCYFARKVSWTKARILASLGRVEEAIRLTEALLHEHEAEEDAIVATALLDLAVFALARGRVGKANRLAMESSARFSSMGAERYARMAANVTTRQ